MSKIWILFGWFLLGCSLSSFLAFLASLHPYLKSWVVFLWMVFIICQLLGWITDEKFASFFKIDILDWWGILLLALVSALMGLGLWLLI